MDWVIALLLLLVMLGLAFMIIWLVGRWWDKTTGRR